MTQADKNWHAIIMAGGSGSRLDPMTRAVNKHLLPVFDKPMIFYPLTTLMLGGLRDFTLVTSPHHVGQFRDLLGDGSTYGINITIREQQRAGGIAECFLICREDIGDKNVALILGDNIFYGAGLTTQIQKGLSRTRGATIFGYDVADPSAFGVVTLDVDGRPVDLVEKPREPVSRIAVPGLYFYDNRVLEIGARVSPSKRGEMEITDVNRAYLDMSELFVELLPRGIAWLDGGTPQDLYEAGQFVQVMEQRTGLRIACPEEVAVRKGYITPRELASRISAYPTSNYQLYLKKLLDELGKV